MTTITEAAPERLYTRQFFQVFGAVGVFMTGVSLQFHFGQYVEFLGYGVDALGWLLSISMILTLLSRLRIGRWIDRFGCRPTWLVGTLLVALAVGSIQFTTQLWLIAVLRAVSMMAMAAVMTTVAVFAANIAPRHRRAESIGTIGLAGFMGMVVGPTLGDWIFAGAGESIAPYRLFFSASAVCSLLSGGVMLWIKMPLNSNASDAHQVQPVAPPGSKTSQISVVIRHWPGAVLLVGFAFGMVFCLQLSFLERLADARGFTDIKVFFLVYGPTAITLRLVFRRAPQQIGRSRTLLGGLLLLFAGLVCLIGIRSQGQLVLPGLLMGAGHCFIFPSMVDLSAEQLPDKWRGTGTALILGAGDVGMLIGFAAMGEGIDAFGFDATLAALAALVLITAGFFCFARRTAVFSRRSSSSSHVQQPA